MREKWYGDERDLVKWATLLQLARERNIRRVIQVTCLVPDGYKGTKDPRAILAADFGSEVADVVWRHFRNLDAIADLGREVGIETVIVAGAYPSERSGRDDYFRSVTKSWLSSPHDPTIIFLDPDTGLGSERTHVSPKQLLTIRAKMKADDALVFYQHEPRYDPGDWRVDRHRDFAEALKVPVAAVTRRHCDVAKDVMFLIWPADRAIEGNRESDARDQAPPPRASGGDEPKVGLRGRVVVNVTRRLRDLLDR
jgi:hypothetical protein